MPIKRSPYSLSKVLIRLLLYFKVLIVLITFKLIRQSDSMVSRMLMGYCIIIFNSFDFINCIVELLLCNLIFLYIFYNLRL